MYCFDYEHEILKNYDPKLIDQPLRITRKDYIEITKTSEENFFKKIFFTDKAILFQNFCECFNLDYSIFDLKVLEKLYGNVKVDVINQQSWSEIEEIGCELTNKQ